MLKMEKPDERRPMSIFILTLGTAVLVVVAAILIWSKLKTTEDRPDVPTYICDSCGKYECICHLDDMPG